MPTGTVSEFDESTGLGTVVTDDGAEYRFHCIEIGDGSRTIDVGQRVAFRPLAKLGRFEAGHVRKV